MKPKRQEDFSCVFAYYFYRGICHRRDTAEKNERRNQFGADQEKEGKKSLRRYGKKISAMPPLLSHWMCMVMLRNK